MCPKDDKGSSSRRSNSSANKCHMDPRHHSSHKDGPTSYAPSHSPATSRRRARRVTSTMPGRGTHRDYFHYNKHDRGAQPLSGMWAKVTLKFALLACVSALLWACLIVRVLGPASSVPGMMTARDKLDMGRETDREGRFTFSISESGERLLPGWTPMGHHSRFLGQDAFPEQFQSWGDGGEVVINGVDVGPLGAANETVPTADLLLAILSGDTEEGREKRDALREMYDKYEGWISVGGKDSRGTNKEPVDMSFLVVFVISSDSAPPDGKLVGDILYVNAPDGYRNIVHKVKHMMGLVRHVSFKYLLKADDDTFVCIKRVATFLHDQPEASKGKIYAGVPTACNIPTNPNRHVGQVIKDRDDKWYDQRFVHHTLSGLDCYPVYMQGAFYVLAQPLVEHLYRGREHYDTFVNEDVTIGSWLLGVDRALATIHDFQSSRLWNCVCGGDFILRPMVRQGQVFFHNCKKVSELRKCSERLFRPALAC